MVMLVACAKFIDVHTTIMEEDHSHQCHKNFEKKNLKFQENILAALSVSILQRDRLGADFIGQFAVIPTKI